MTSEPASPDRLPDGRSERNAAPPLPAMKLSLFHTFVFLPAWFRSAESDAPPPDPGSESAPGKVAPVWTETHHVRFPLYLSDAAQPRSRGHRGDHPW